MVDKQEDFARLSLLAGKLLTIVSHSLGEIDLKESDLAVAGLALKYAKEIDEGNLSVLARLGPLLLTAMESLQMSPKSRALAAKGGTTNNVKPPSRLDELQKRRGERANRASDIHTATS